MKFSKLALSLLALPFVFLGAEECQPLCCSATSPYYGELGYRTRKGVGYDEGYASVRFLATPCDYCNWIPFLDLRAHLFDDSKPAGNVGVGIRRRVDSCELLWGANLYYDYRRAYSRNVHQAGIGFELLKECWKVRLNGYWPFAGTRNMGTPKFNKFYRCDFITNRRDHVALRGVDLDIEGRLYSCGERFEINGGVTPYYYRSPHSSRDFLGAKLRLNFMICKYLFVTAEYSHDRVFDDRVNGEFTLRIPFGGKQTSKYQRPKSCIPCPIECCCDASMMRRAVSRPHRQEIIAVRKETRHQRRPLDEILEFFP